jgi:hypothetical protein
MYDSIILTIITKIFSFLSNIDTFVALIVGYFFAKNKFKFESSHKRRLEIIEEAYEKIAIANSVYRSLTNPLQEAGELNLEEKEKTFIEKANEAIEFLDNKKIFFSSVEQTSINLIKGEFIRSWGDYRYKKYIESDPNLLKERTELYKKTWEAASQEIPNLISSLEDTFKKELGLK